MRILLVDPDEARRERVVEGLNALDDVRILIVENTFGVTQHVEKFQPDMVIVACESPARDAIEDLRRVSESNPRPILMFVDHAEPEQVEDALRAGVAAYVAEGLEPQRIRAILDLASAQFRVMDEMRRDLARARADLAARKTIEKAKGLLMKQRKLGEEEAYALMRKAAMDQGKSLAAIADALIAAASLLGDIK
jgi:two-component system, response regulator / RNA-binding antiterminator